MTITKAEWLSFALKKGSISKIDRPVCGLGFVIKNEKPIDLILQDKKYIPILGIGNWIKYGLENQWIDQPSCPEHDNNNINILMTIERSDVVHLKMFEERINVGDYLTIINRPLNPDYTGYMATNPHLIEDIIATVKKIDTCNSFIDIGCGPGSVLKYLNNEYDYLYGIDIEKDFIKQASKILPKALLDNVSAENYLLPDTKMHIYMYNAFTNKILDKFLYNNIDNIKRNKSILIYNSPFIADHLIKLYGMEPIYSKDIFAIYK